MVDWTGDGETDEDRPGEPEEPVDEQYQEPEEDPFDVAPDPPEPPDLSEQDVDPEIATRFWALVAVFNIALLGLSVGLMFIAFEGNIELGGQLFAGGVVLSLYGFYRYRQTKRKLRTDQNS